MMKLKEEVKSRWFSTILENKENLIEGSIYRGGAHCALGWLGVACQELYHQGEFKDSQTFSIQEECIKNYLEDKVYNLLTEEETNTDQQSEFECKVINANDVKGYAPEELVEYLKGIC